MDAVKGPGDGARLLLTVLLAGWALAYAYSVLEAATVWNAAAPFDLSLRDRPVLHFLGWQGVAGVLAVAVYGVSRLWPRGAAARQIGSLPLLLALLLIAGIAALVVLGAPAG